MSRRSSSRDPVFKQLIEINTTDTPAGNVTTVAKAMAQRLPDAGFPPADALGPNPRKPILVCHLDVVHALLQDWSMEPLTFIEKDGYFYRRGTEDTRRCHLRAGRWASEKLYAGFRLEVRSGGGRFFLCFRRVLPTFTARSVVMFRSDSRNAQSPL
jgi:hypothetical protein